MMTKPVINLQPYQIVRPEKVTWWWPAQKDLWSGIRSESLRKFLKKIDQTLLQANIRWEHAPLSLQAYLDWLPYYREKMTELGYDLFATPDWYAGQTAQEKTVEAIFCYQNQKMIGSGIIGRTADTATLHFKASDRMNVASSSNSSLGAVIDFLFLKEMLEQGVAKISSGTSRNAFGVINSFGYLDYKLRLGFDPSPATDSPLLNDVPTNDNGEVVFYGLQQQKPAFFRFYPIGSGTVFDDTRLKSLAIPFMQITYEDKL